MKLDSTRINETIAFINNNPNLPVLRRQAVAQFCRAMFPKLSLLDFGPYKTEFQALSGEMSVKTHATVPAGTANERAMRRAILLIWRAMGKRQAGGVGGALPAANAAMTMPAGNLPAALAIAVMKAAVMASPASAGDLFTNEFIAHPRQFLVTHKAIVLGLGTGADKFTNLHVANYTNLLQFHFQFDPGNDRFVFNGLLSGQLGASHPFQTVSVPAVNWYDVPGNGGQNAPNAPGNFSQILGCELTGATVMVTTQFTGCAFCWTDHGGVIRAAHLGPTRAGYPSAALPTSYPGAGHALANRLLNQGNPPPGGIGAAAGMANAAGAALTVFGRGAGNAPVVGGGNPYYPDGTLQWATIVGRFQNGAWKFYMQAVDRNTNQISEARRIL